MDQELDLPVYASGGELSSSSSASEAAHSPVRDESSKSPSQSNRVDFEWNLAPSRLPKTGKHTKPSGNTTKTFAPTAKTSRAKSTKTSRKTSAQLKSNSTNATPRVRKEPNAIPSTPTKSPIQFRVYDFVWISGKVVDSIVRGKKVPASKGTSASAEVEERPWWPARVVKVGPHNKVQVKPYLSKTSSPPAKAKNCGLRTVESEPCNIVPLRADMRRFQELRDQGLRSKPYGSEFLACMNLLYSDEMNTGDLDEEDGDSSELDLPTMASALTDSQGFSQQKEKDVEERRRKWREQKLARKNRKLAEVEASTVTQKPDRPAKKKAKTMPKDFESDSDENPLMIKWTEDSLETKQPPPPSECQEKCVGAKVLAKIRGDPNHYHPGLIREIRGDGSSNVQYQVELWDGQLQWIKANHVLAPSDRTFFTAPISPHVISEQELDDSYEDEELAEKIDLLHEELEDILEGRDPDCWRYSHFMAGGRRRAVLTQKASRGPFTSSEFYFIMRYLQNKYCPKTKPLPPPKALSMTSNEKDREEDSFSYQALLEETAVEGSGGSALQLDRLDMVCTVLVPEVIVRLIEQKEMCSREEAEEIMMQPSTAGWVQEIMTLRELHASGMTIIL